jgi:hypothetical protein
MSISQMLSPYILSKMIACRIYSAIVHRLTTIDTTERLSFALLQQLVYTNIMDKYLPGIEAVLSGEVSP